MIIKTFFRQYSIKIHFGDILYFFGLILMFENRENSLSMDLSEVQIVQFLFALSTENKCEKIYELYSPDIENVWEMLMRVMYLGRDDR